MKWVELLDKAGREPVFTTSLLLAGNIDPRNIRRQLSRWVKEGRLGQLRRGLYVLSEPYRKIQPHPFLVANRLKKASYVSLQSALAEYGMIPEHVPVITSVTTGRPEEVSTPLGAFLYKHMKKSRFCGYESRDFGTGQAAFIATPEKALLDLLYLTPHADEWAFLRELRLQNLDQLDDAKLRTLAAQSGSAKLERAAERILKFKVEGRHEEL